jgi:molecular chaperone IbpA
MKSLAKIVSDDILNRQFIGYNQLLDDFGRITNTSTNFPPHNVIEIDDNTVDIELALAGFKSDDINVTVENGMLTITGEQVEEDDRNYRYRGIAARTFTRSFRLAEYWEAADASFNDGILTVRLVQEIPEAKKPKSIEIKTS